MKIGDERLTVGAFDCGPAKDHIEIEFDRSKVLQTRTRAATSNSWFNFIIMKSCSCLAALERQSKRGHLVIVANKQNVSGKHRMIPGLAFERRELGQRCELIRRRLHKRELALLRQNQQQVLIGAAVAGFVIGGGIAGFTGLFRRRRRY